MYKISPDDSKDPNVPEQQPEAVQVKYEKIINQLEEKGFLISPYREKDEKDLFSIKITTPKKISEPFTSVPLFIHLHPPYSGFWDQLKIYTRRLYSLKEFPSKSLESACRKNSKQERSYL